MPNTKLPANDLVALDGIAELLMWFGWDRCADAIYSIIETELAASNDGSTGQWADVFAA
jgi:hypothetical protein